MDEFELVTQAKEELCYVSTDFDKEMKQTRYKDSNTPSIVREFVLPDYKSVMKGYARNPADTINNNIKNRQVLIDVLHYSAISDSAVVLAFLCSVLIYDVNKHLAVMLCYVQFNSNHKMLMLMSKY
eukprot:6861-Heterococcus_DN1.PRE.1